MNPENLKSSIDQPAHPSAFLISLGVLSGYMRRSLLFLLLTAVGYRRFSRRIPGRFPAAFVRLVGFQAWLYIRLKEKLGPEKGLEVMRAVILTGGAAIQQSGFRTVEAGRTWENLIHFQQRNNREGATRWNEMEVITQNEAAYEIRVTRCLFLEFFSELGIPELTKSICALDNLIFSSYLPEEVTFHRGGLRQRMSDGGAECRFVMEHRAARSGGGVEPAARLRNGRGDKLQLERS